LEVTGLTNHLRRLLLNHWIRKCRNTKAAPLIFGFSGLHINGSQQPLSSVVLGAVCLDVACLSCLSKVWKETTKTQKNTIKYRVLFDLRFHQVHRPWSRRAIESLRTAGRTLGSSFANPDWPDSESTDKKDWRRLEMCLQLHQCVQHHNQRPTTSANPALRRHIQRCCAVHYASSTVLYAIHIKDSDDCSPPKCGNGDMA